MRSIAAGREEGSYVRIDDAESLQVGAYDPWFTLIDVTHDIGFGRLFYVTVVKRAVDVVAATIILTLLCPLLLLVSAAIRVDSPGPSLFKQQRVGQRGKTFIIYKFRTMANKPSDEITWLIDPNGTARHKVRNDPRVTRVGHWLRKSSIDELPQLINVIKGDMSLVGPRPELPDIVDTYQPWQRYRHLVRPGITGWWQISGRSNLPMHENTELDLFYIRNLSPSLDLRVVLKTIAVVFRGVGAF